VLKKFDLAAIAVVYMRHRLQIRWAMKDPDGGILLADKGLVVVGFW